jgi:hypothetical protein
VLDLLERAMSWLDGRRRQYVGREVVYQRDQQTLTVPATIGRTVFETVDQYGVVVRSESRDFLISASDLALGGVMVVPERGDRIRESQGEDTFVYEVLAPGQEPCWRYSDPYRQTLRIHTAQVGQEET